MLVGTKPNTDSAVTEEWIGSCSIIAMAQQGVGTYGLARNPKRCKVGWMPPHSAGWESF